MAAIINTEWFQDRIRYVGITQAELGKRIGKDPSSMSLLLKGERKMTVEVSAQIAKELGVSTEEVMIHAGANPAESSLRRIPVIGFIDGTGDVSLSRKPTGTVPYFGAIEPHSCALIMRTIGTPLDYINGYTYFVGAERDVGIEGFIGRTVIAKLADSDRISLRILQRGAQPSRYTLTGYGQKPVHETELDWVRQVLMIKPI